MESEVHKQIMKDKVFAIAIDDEGIFMTELTEKGYNLYKTGEFDSLTYDDLWEPWVSVNSIVDIPQEIRMRIPIDIIVEGEDND